MLAFTLDIYCNYSILSDRSFATSKRMLPLIVLGDRCQSVGSPIDQAKDFPSVRSDVHGRTLQGGVTEGCATRAAIARRRCLPHDCHFKCAIMAAGFAKKNAILRNSSRAAPRRHSLRRPSRFYSAAGSTPPVSLLVSRSPSPSSSPVLVLGSVQGPADADRRWAFHCGLRATGRDLTVVHSLFACHHLRLPIVSSSFLSSTLTSSLSFSPNIFTFFPAPVNPSFLAFVLYLNPTPFAYTSLSSLSRTSRCRCLLPLLLLLHLFALPPPVELLVYSALSLLHFRQQKSTCCTMTFSV